MTKAEIVTKITRQTGCEKVDVQQILESFFESIKGAMADGENIYMRGFGSFVLKKRASKVARNITEQTSIVVPAHYVPSFKPSKEFTDEVKKKVLIEAN